MFAWLTGKKTYIGAAALAVTLIAGFWLGTIDVTTLSAGLSACLIIVGLGHKYDRYLAVAVSTLEEVKQQKGAKQIAGDALAGAATAALDGTVSGQ